MTTEMGLATFLLMSSVLLFFNSNSWVILWTLLEVNTVSFILVSPKKEKAPDKNKSDSLMKYFIIQSVSSSMLMFLTIFLSQEKLMDNETLSWSLSMILMLKVAMSPLHVWFMEVTKKLSWTQMTLLFTWQKLPMIFLLSFSLKMSVFILMLMASLIPSMEQMLSTDVLSIMILSSVFNNLWLTAASILSMKSFFVFTMLYYLSVMFMMLELRKKETGALTKTPIWPSSVSFSINLGGLPPSSMFLGKWILMLKFNNWSMMVTTLTLLIFSLINVSVYLRMMMMKLLNKPTWLKESVSSMTKMNYITVFSLIPLVW